jgi:hypothetical protein
MIPSHPEVTCENCGHRNKMDFPTCHSIMDGTSDIPCSSCPASLTEQYQSEKRSREENRSGRNPYKPPHPLTNLIPSSKSDWGWLLLFIIPVILLNGC